MKRIAYVADCQQWILTRRANVRDRRAKKDREQFKRASHTNTCNDPDDAPPKHSPTEKASAPTSMSDGDCQLFYLPSQSRL